ncbi:MAG: metallopeptidase TldD-related protein [Firmicutes bacterium]|nr:metallopeptidase TldD-related protein [Bacillota bacterium]
MNKEIVSVKKSTTKLKITNGVIDGVFKASDTKTGLRLYDKGVIGIAGAIGAFDEKKLEKRAKEMLKFNISYPVKPTEKVKRKVDLSKQFKLTDKQLADGTEQILAELGAAYPEFNFSHEVWLQEWEETLKNDVGTDLSYKDKVVMTALSIKHKKSLNMFDGFIQSYTRGFDKEAVLTLAEKLAAFNNLVEITDGEVYPVIFTGGALTTYFIQHLNGRMFGTGASVFAGKLNEKLFAENFSLLVDRNPNEFTNFFDGDGTTLENDKFYLIENGVLKSPYSGKKVAAEFGFANTASASLEYDGVPGLSPSGISIKGSGKSVAELVGSGKAILTEIVSGGDFTPQGEYSTPVQVAYLWENGKVLGRLPQIAVSSNVYDLFGKDFVGQASDGPYKNSISKYVVHNMKATKIGPHI